jgi:hypothetical protein
MESVTTLSILSILSIYVNYLWLFCTLHPATVMLATALQGPVSPVAICQRA